MKLAELKQLNKQLRNFNVHRYLSNKTERINQFFKSSKLDSCVIGISGGVDSATVLSLINHASKQLDSPIKKIVPIIAPIHGDGTTGQKEAEDLAVKQCQHLNIPYKIVNLTEAYQNYISASDETIKENLQAWVNGQLASILRTPCFYYHAAILQTKGFNSIVVGTTNRDEGSYIGFFGKASDAMVDLQPIGDLHKSEVYQLAEILDVINEILTRSPRGDVWNGSTSEEMMGTPYWFLEMYLLIKEYELQVSLDQEDKILYNIYADKIEELHNKNYHKYEVGMPSHFIDYLPRKVPMRRRISDGWRISNGW